MGSYIVAWNLLLFHRERRDIMAEKRQNRRIECAEKCLLYYADSKYNGAVMNISISGALVTLHDTTPINIAPGDTCSVLLSSDPTTSFLRYRSRVIRVDHAGVGLKILEHEF